MPGDPGLSQTPRAADRDGRCRRPHRYRAGCWSVAARGRDDAQAGCRRPRARPNTRTDSRPTALATRSQYRSSVARSGARISCGTSISMPSTMARKSSRLRSNRRNRGDIVAQPRRRMALIQRVDIVAPLLKRGQPLRPRPVGIGDVVDLPAKAVDLKHRLALLARQNAHRRVKRTAGRGRPVTRHWLPPYRASCAGRRFGRRAAARPRGGSFRWPSRRRCGRAVAIGPRCTVSLRGSRTFSRRDDLVGEAPGSRRSRARAGNPSLRR